MVSNGQIILYPIMVTSYAGGYTFSYVYGQFSILKIQIWILLDWAANFQLVVLMTPRFGAEEVMLWVWGLFQADAWVVW